MKALARRSGRSRRCSSSSASGATCRTSIDRTVRCPTNSPQRTHQGSERLPARHAGRGPARRDHRRDRRGRCSARQIPRHVPAGRSRPARRTHAQEDGEGLRLHDPRAHARRRVHARAVAYARPDRARLRQRHDAPDHAAGDPAARRHQVEPEGDAAGRSTTRCSTRSRPAATSIATSCARQPVPVAGACGRARAGARRSPTICRRARLPIARSGSTARRIAGGEEEAVEPIYGKTYLPRKFKTVFAVPPANDIDVFAQDLGFIAIVDEPADRGLQRHGRRRHGHDARRAGNLSAPRRRDRLLPTEDARAGAEAVVTVQRDWGDRANRKHARLKYTIDDRGLDGFRDGSSAAGVKLGEPRPFAFTSTGDRYGWPRATSGRGISRSSSRTDASRMCRASAPADRAAPRSPSCTTAISG